MNDEILIYDSIGEFGVRPLDVLAALKAAGGRPVTVRINSPGGTVTDGTTIYNALKTVCVDGLAASIASYIMLAGSRVRMASNAFVMIHNVSGGSHGEAADLRKYADVMDKMRDVLVTAYADKTKLAPEHLRSLMDAETWMTADEALAAGFVDEIFDGTKAIALFDVTKFRNAPASLVDRIRGDMTDIANLEAKLTAAQAQAQANFTDLNNVRAELIEANKLRESIAAELITAKAAITAAQAEAATNRADAEAAKAKLSEVEAALPARINAEVTRVVAASGHAPVEAEITPTPAETTPKKPELKGLAKTQAAFAAQLRK